MILVYDWFDGGFLKSNQVCRTCHTGIGGIAVVLLWTIKFRLFDVLSILQ